MIQVSSLNFAHRKQDPLFDMLSFHLKAGSITGLLGKNGAGKTTLLKLLAGLLIPKDGRIQVLEATPAKRQVSLLQNIFYVPEEFYLPSTTVANYIKANCAFYPNFDLEGIKRTLGAFGLSDQNHLGKLSYGQKKKFLISFALATNCKLLIMDEPTNGLDIPSKSIFRKVLAGSLKEGQLVLISTHQVKDIENLIDRIVVLDSGKIILDKDMIEISSKLSFNSAISNDEALYSEEAIGGYRVIKKQINGSSEVDLELLFNALTEGKILFESHENK